MRGKSAQRGERPPRATSDLHPRLVTGHNSPGSQLGKLGFYGAERLADLLLSGVMA
jgi:hypothetical protein